MKNKSFHIYAFITSIMWSLGYVMTRMCVKYISPGSIAALRVCIAALALLIIVFAAGLPKPKKRDMGWFILSGITGIFLYIICFNKGASTVSTATGNVMLAVCPPITAIGARVLYKEKLSTLQWLSIGVCFAGVVVLTVLSGGMSMNAGLLWLAAAVVLMAIYNLVQKKLTRSYPSLCVTAWSSIIGAVGMLFFLPDALPALAKSPAAVWPPLLVLGLGCSALAFCSWTKAFSLADKSSSVSNYMFINPFISALFGYFFIGDSIEQSALIGGSIIMLGLAMFNFGPGIMEKLKK